MTKRLCTFAGCNVVVEHTQPQTSPRCAKHQRKETVQDRQGKYNHHKDETGRNIYHTKRWRQIRKAHLLMNPLCVRCNKFGISTIATVVDHIKEIKDGTDPYDMTNLQSLCKTHHNVKSGEEKRKRNKVKTYPSLSDFK